MILRKLIVAAVILVAAVATSAAIAVAPHRAAPQQSADLDGRISAASARLR
jgi:hypothetical protein